MNEPKRIELVKKVINAKGTRLDGTEVLGIHINLHNKGYKKGDEVYVTVEKIMKSKKKVK